MSLPPIAVLAGGLASRLQPISLTVPKWLARVNGEPFCAIQLRQLKAQGFDRVVLLIGVMGDQIRQEVGDGDRFGLSVSYLEDGPEPLGTGGPVARARPRLGPLFFVTYGDTLLRYDPRAVVKVLKRTGAAAAMVVLRNDGRWDRSNVVLEGDYVARYSKGSADRSGMRWIDYGATLFTDAAFADVGDGPFDLAAVLERLSQERRLVAHEVHERFYEIGTPAALAETERYLAAQGDVG